MSSLNLFKKIFFTYLSVIIADQLFAQEIPDSLYKVNDSIYSTARPQDVKTTRDLPGITFYVDYNYKAGDGGGIIDDRDGFFHGQVTIIPHITADTENHILRVALDVKGKILEAKEGGLSISGDFDYTKEDVSAAQLHIASIKVYLGDRDTTILWKDCLGGDINIPNGVTTLKELEVVYEGHYVLVRKTLFFGDATATINKTNKEAKGNSSKSSIPWIWVLPALFIILGVLGYWKFMRRR